MNRVLYYKACWQLGANNNIKYSKPDIFTYTDLKTSKNIHLSVLPRHFNSAAFDPQHANTFGNIYNKIKNINLIFPFYCYPSNSIQVERSKG